MFEATRQLVALKMGQDQNALPALEFELLAQHFKSNKKGQQALTSLLDSDLPQKEFNMRSYCRLTLEHRYQIKALKDSGLSIRGIAKVILVSPSTVSRELKRTSKNYFPKSAQAHAEERRKLQGAKKKIKAALQLTIDGCLEQQWSPEQISGRLKRDDIHINYETIYKYIYSSKDTGLFKHLRRKRKWRRTRREHENRSTNGFRRNQSWIEERPAVVEERKRLGDFERDLILGKESRMLTIVDRVSKKTKIKKLPRHSSHETHFATLELLSGFKVHTITNDNGPEFSLHSLTAKELNAQIYFARPYCSWQRGTNENTNGLLRQYYPKGTDFNAISDEEIQKIEDRLNNRPRKSLGYLTPNEVHKRLSQGVALDF